jgi:hypothetical protein
VYNDALNVFDTAPFRIFTLALIGALLYHSFNGIRIILVDFWWRPAYVVLAQPSSSWPPYLGPAHRADTARRSCRFRQGIETHTRTYS